MDIPRSEARESLNQIKDTVERTRKMVAYGGGDVLFIVWGVIWVLGYSSTHFLPLVTQWIWLALVAPGILISVIVGKRQMPVKSPVDKRITWFWWLLFLYVGLWVALLSPLIEVNGPEQSQMFWKHYGALVATVPMFAYVVTGLWLEHFMIWIGLAVTALTVLGLLLLQPYFFLWMAITGGGTLIGTGLVIRKRWR